MYANCIYIHKVIRLELAPTLSVMLGPPPEAENYPHREGHPLAMSLSRPLSPGTVAPAAAKFA
jgi:hypothetical protein